MIRRELLHNPTAVVGFDWFNDYKDTERNLRRLEDTETARLLEKGYYRWLRRFSRQWQRVACEGKGR